MTDLPLTRTTYVSCLQDAAWEQLFCHTTMLFAWAMGGLLCCCQTNKLCRIWAALDTIMLLLRLTWMRYLCLKLLSYLPPSPPGSSDVQSSKSPPHCQCPQCTRQSAPGMVQVLPILSIVPLDALLAPDVSSSPISTTDSVLLVLRCARKATRDKAKLID